MSKLRSVSVAGIGLASPFSLPEVGQSLGSQKNVRLNVLVSIALMAKPVVKAQHPTLTT